MRHRILLVEDDAKLGAQLRDTLADAGFAPTWIARGDEALSVRPHDFALAVLDLMLPGAYGLDVLKHLRAAADLPVLVLSARTETLDKVRALELGADDFVTKPFWPEELLARIAARLRRPGLVRGSTLRLGTLEIDADARAVRVGNAAVELTRVEFDLLAALARRPGAPITRSELVTTCLDPVREGTERTLDGHVSRLRKKLGAEGQRIETVWGIGYRLAADGQAR